MTSKSMRTKRWAESVVGDRFEEAVRTLRRLHVPHTKPSEYFNTWPPIVRTCWELMAQEKLPVCLGPPSSDAIMRMEETFDWLYWLEIEERNLIWWRAEKKPWKPICLYLGCSRNKAWQMWVYALIKITHHLNEDNKDIYDNDNGDRIC